MDRLKVLVTGSTGFVGSHLITSLTARDTWVLLADHLDGKRQFDLAVPGELSSFVERHQPDVIIHTAAISSIAACAANTHLADAVNTQALQELADIAKRINGRIIHLSTDQVFDGHEAPYSEEDKTAPLHHYGATKLAAETVLLASQTNAVILRPTLIYGNARSFPRSASESIRQAAEHELPIHLFIDEYRSPLSLDDLETCIAYFISAGKKGLYHVAGPEKFSRFQFGEAVCDALGLGKEQLRPTELKGSSFASERPANLCLTTDKLSQTMSWQPRTVATILQQNSSQQ